MVDSLYRKKLLQCLQKYTRRKSAFIGSHSNKQRSLHNVDQ